ncbi:hypothetical protein U9M48_013537 [Paspalum notatum var. saurae]|uniref:Uncharacterized protein n=1 Tax=Paspalum notatum var. saurae TaxID=547442 RepID=A0AAQ3T1Z8_PASNO
MNSIHYANPYNYCSKGDLSFGVLFPLPSGLPSLHHAVFMLCPPLHRPAGAAPPIPLELQHLPWPSRLAGGSVADPLLQCAGRLKLAPSHLNDQFPNEISANGMAFPYNGYMIAFPCFPLLEAPSDDDLDTVVAAYAAGVLPVPLPQLHKPRYSIPRVMVRRDINEGWLRLQRDFFCANPVYPESYFRRMYRMSIRLFRRIADDVTRYDDYFEQGINAALKPGSHPYQKILASLKILATGCTPFSIDREFSISRSVIDKSFKRFIRAVVKIFGPRYLRPPNAEDIKALLQTAEHRGFPGMLGSIDCMHWAWEKCPTSWHGEHIGHIDKPTLILEAVAGPNLWIWHAFFGMPGSCNDINVLHRSPVFDDIAAGTAPSVSYVVNGNQYDMGYYLADGIYPDWATLVKGVPAPMSDKEKLFIDMQSAYRKDVERAFGVLQAKFKIVKGPAQMMKTRDLEYAMSCCVILQNMAAEDEKDEPLPHPEDYDNESADGRKKIESKTTHQQLQQDLMEHVWTMFGDRASLPIGLGICGGESASDVSAAESLMSADVRSSDPLNSHLK